MRLKDYVGKVINLVMGGGIECLRAATKFATMSGETFIVRVWLNGNGSGRLLFSCTQLVWV
jgi:hypothetical protein